MTWSRANDGIEYGASFSIKIRYAKSIDSFKYWKIDKYFKERKVRIRHTTQDKYRKFSAHATVILRSILYRQLTFSIILIVSAITELHLTDNTDCTFLALHLRSVLTQWAHDVSLHIFPIFSISLFSCESGTNHHHVTEIKETNYINVFFHMIQIFTIAIYPLSSYILHQSMCQTSHYFPLLALSNRLVVIIPMIMQILSCSQTYLKNRYYRI